MTRAVAVVAWLFGLYWIIWRWTVSLNPHAMTFSILLAFAETWGLWNSFVLLVTCWRLTYRQSPPAPAGLSADVFITAYDEPLDVLRRTVIAARAIRYPHKTHLLDDGKRDEVKAMAEAAGINYIRREGSEGAKAGNINNALKLTDGEFILQLDADHVALPNILDRLLGYFEDPKLAFVQSPQDYYNTTSFTHVVNDEGRRLWEENRMFYSLILPGKDAWNSTFFCGSCGVIRRAALDSIGGFSTLSITEDMETSIVLHAKGWKSAFHPETLAYGLSPTSALAYHVQRLRWGQGAMQILKKLNPLKQKGLSRMQKFQYMSSATTYFDGFQKLVLYFSPALFFFTGWLPVRVSNAQLLTRLIPYSILTLLAFEMLSRGTGWFLIAERYNMVRFWTYMRATTTLFSNKKLKFAVTPKGLSGSVPLGVYLPQVAILVLSLASLIWATLASHYHWIDYRGGGWGSAAFYVNTIWIGWNVYFSGLIIYQSRSSGQQRFDHRFVDPFPVIVKIIGGSAPVTEDVFAITHDLNPGGLSFRTSVQLERGTKVSLPLTFEGTTYEATGEIVHVGQINAREGRIYSHGVKFENMPATTTDAIELHCTQHAVPMMRMTYRQSINLFSRTIEVIGNIRRDSRKKVQLPAKVAIEATEHEEGGFGIALLEDVSRRGARLLMEKPIEPGRTIHYSVPGTRYTGSGVVIFSRALESPMRVRFVIGVGQVKKESRGWWGLGWAPRARAAELKVAG